MDFQQQQAIYLQIADFICEKILRKGFVEGDKILSIREMAKELEVNPNTVARTYNYLELKEIIYKQRGVGYFVSKDCMKKSLGLIRDKFLKIELPSFFKSIDLLEISLADINGLYQKWRCNEN